MPRIRRVVVQCLVLLLCAAVASCSRSSEPPRPANLSLTLGFRCLWWSEQQMEGMNPNAPPPKTTEVTIQRWEYSDPVAVPHPDMLDAVLEVKNESDSAETVSIEWTTAWQVGPLKDRSRATWENSASAGKVESAAVPARSQQAFRLPIRVADKMKSLEAGKQWPWALRVGVQLQRKSGGAAEKKEAELPILPGD